MLAVPCSGMWWLPTASELQGMGSLRGEARGSSQHGMLTAMANDLTLDLGGDGGADLLQVLESGCESMISSTQVRILPTRQE